MRRKLDFIGSRGERTGEEVRNIHGVHKGQDSWFVTALEAR